jgi:hypothetical protein
MEYFILLVVIGLIPAYIAKNKGGSLGLWWLYGMVSQFDNYHLRCYPNLETMFTIQRLFF